jgi:hypothetical protein
MNTDYDFCKSATRSARPVSRLAPARVDPAPAG